MVYLLFVAAVDVNVVVTHNVLLPFRIVKSRKLMKTDRKLKVNAVIP